MTLKPFADLLHQALASRAAWFDARHQGNNPADETAFRLFNGFVEGCPDLVIDLYGQTVLFHNYARDPREGEATVREALTLIQKHPRLTDRLRAAIVKVRNGRTAEEKSGKVIFGAHPDRKIREHGVWYAIDLLANRDAGLYLDTRNLRKWLIKHSAGKTVLNAFAYSGSLGVAAMAGGASRVMQLDRSRTFLNIARTSCTLNGFPIHRGDFIAGDFFSRIGRFRRTGAIFDCVIIDPPFFSVTARGRVDQVTDSARLINKVRPLVNDGGYLIAVNNALYVSGRDYMQTLETLCQDGYLTIMELIGVPEDFIGYPGTRVAEPVTDPAPFNHSTKIAVLGVQRK